MKKRFIFVLISVLLISSAMFGSVSASGNSGYQVPYWNNSYTPYNCCNCSWYCGDPCCSSGHYNPYTPQLCASFVSDVTVPDGSYVAPGASFVKTWQIRNNGNTTWNTNYQLVFSSGSQLSGPAAVSLPHSVAPGQTVDVSVTLTAPVNAGKYRGYWMLKSDTGQLFGVGAGCKVAVWVEITTSKAYCQGYNCCFGSWYCAPETFPPSIGVKVPMTQPAVPTWPGW